MSHTESTLVERQPVAVFLGGLTGVVGLGLAAATSLDWIDLTLEQAAAVIAFVAGACALVGRGLWGAVYAPATVEAMTGTTPGEFA